jgi:hypothetical protein
LPQAELILPEQQQQRIVSGKRRKTLGGCLSVGSIPDRSAGAKLSNRLTTAVSFWLHDVCKSKLQ